MEEYDFSQGKRGAMDPIPPGKTRITISLDNEVLEWFRQQVHLAGGGNYQTLINEVLRQHIQGVVKTSWVEDLVFSEYCNCRESGDY